LFVDEMGLGDICINASVVAMVVGSMGYELHRKPSSTHVERPPSHSEGYVTAALTMPSVEGDHLFVSTSFDYEGEPYKCGVSHAPTRFDRQYEVTGEDTQIHATQKIPFFGDPSEIHVDYSELPSTLNETLRTQTTEALVSGCHNAYTTYAPASGTRTAFKH
jgi:hypothetical protein